MSGKQLKGKIVSDKMTNTVVVIVDLDKKHPIYNKSIKNTKRINAKNTIGAKVGDEVLIQESRPFAANTSWIIVSKVAKKEGK